MIIISIITIIMIVIVVAVVVFTTTINNSFHPGSLRLLPKQSKVITERVIDSYIRFLLFSFGMMKSEHTHTHTYIRSQAQSNRRIDEVEHGQHINPTIRRVGHIRSVPDQPEKVTLRQLMLTGTKGMNRKNEGCHEKKIT
jgi:hypothetical protein